MSFADVHRGGRIDRSLAGHCLFMVLVSVIRLVRLDSCGAVPAGRYYQDSPGKFFADLLRAAFARTVIEASDSGGALSRAGIRFRAVWLRSKTFVAPG